MTRKAPQSVWCHTVKAFDAVMAKNDPARMGCVSAGSRVVAAPKPQQN